MGVIRPFSEVILRMPNRLFACFFATHSKTMSTQSNRPVITPISLSISRWSADCVTYFINFSFLGGVWGCFNSIPIPGSKEALAIAESGKFVPLRPFSSISSVGYYGATIGSVVFVSKFVSGGVAVVRGRYDLWNELIGFGAVAAYWSTVLSHDTRVVWNNRFVGGALASAVVYASVAP
jgi:hypothetical protein